YDWAPLEFTRAEALDARAVRVIAVGDSYAVIWQDRASRSTRIRRLGAIRDSWHDVDALTLSVSFDAAFATDGADLLVFDTVPCPTAGSGQCLATRRISFGAALTAGEPVIIARAEGRPRFATAFNGSEFLLVWSETKGGEVICTCPPPDGRAVALRVRRDGTAIDPDPLLLAGWKPGEIVPTVAWDGERWIAAWIELLQVLAVPISREGAIQGTGARSVVRESSYRDFVDEVVLAPRNGGVVLFSRLTHTSSESSTNKTLVWEAATLGTGRPLEELALAPRMTLLTARSSANTYWTLAAATRGDEVVIAFDAPGDAATGFAQRVFSRIYAQLSRLRSVARR
ncbi:MAG: hypothetical protein WA208_19470, partial [Thermoanaerobaculia bacterium]